MVKIKHYFSRVQKIWKLHLSFPSQNSRKWIAKLRKFNRSFDYIHQGIQDKKIVSVKTIKDGGVAVAVAK